MSRAANGDLTRSDSDGSMRETASSNLPNSKGGVHIDYVTAQKWFNLAAMRGNEDAVRLRREIADRMSEKEIASAQRAARAWLKTH